MLMKARILCSMLKAPSINSAIKHKFEFVHRPRVCIWCTHLLCTSFWCATGVTMVQPAAKPEARGVPDSKPMQASVSRAVLRLIRLEISAIMVCKHCKEKHTAHWCTMYTHDAGHALCTQRFQFGRQGAASLQLSGAKSKVQSQGPFPSDDYDLQ